MPAREPDRSFAAFVVGSLGFVAHAAGAPSRPRIVVLTDLANKFDVEVVDKADERPVWVTVWGGVNTLAQALHDVRSTRDEAAAAKFVSKSRVYTSGAHLVW